MTRVRQDKEGGLQSSVGLLDQSLGRASGQAKSKVAECPGGSRLTGSQLCGESQAPVPGSRQESPCFLGEGAGWERGAAHPAPEVLPEMPASFS